MSVASRRYRFSGALFLVFALSLFVRLFDLGAGSIQVDEIHWKDRSERIWRLFRAGKLSSFTNEPGHPGVPPALLMAVSQGVAGQLNGWRGATPDDPRYIDRYLASRAGVSSFSALLPLVAALGVVSVVGGGMALAFAVLAATDPNHIGLSRLAHLDGAMSVLVLGAILSYFIAVERRSFVIKVCSGVLWGLSILTKPTAVALLPTFLLWKIVRNRLVSRESDSGEREIVSWSDLWAVVFGHLSFALLYSRMWHHNSVYRTQLRVESSIADILFGVGTWLREAPLFAGMVGAAIVLLLLGVTREWRISRFLRGYGHTRYHLAMFSAVLYLALWWFPEVLENFARFWTRVSGLHAVTHRAVAYETSEVAPGYLWLWFSRTPSYLLLCFALGLGVVVRDTLQVKRRAKSDGADTRSLSLSWLMILAVFCWTALLATSSKQAYRYLLPVLPSFLFLALVGTQAGLRLFARWRGVSPPRSVSFYAVLLAGAVHLYWSARLFPDNLFFFNSISGGIHAAMERIGNLPTAGSRELLNFLHNRAAGKGEVQQIAILGDIDPYVAEYKRRYPSETPQIKFVHERNVLSEEELIVLPPMAQNISLSHRYDWESLPSLFTYRVEGELVLTMVTLPIPDYRKPAQESFVYWYRRTGEVVGKESLSLRGGTPGYEYRDVVLADPSRHPKGFLYFGEGFRVDRGEYRLTFVIASLERSQAEGARGVMNYELGRECSGLIMEEELVQGEFTHVTKTCVFSEPRKAQLRGTWFRKVHVALESVILERATPEELGSSHEVSNGAD